MAQRDGLGFQWSNYPQHRFLICLRYKQAQRLRKCSICARFPVVRFTALVHVALRSVETPGLDPKQLIRSLGLCREHDRWSDEELSAWVWPT
jgi:hypothetical protein